MICRNAVLMQSVIGDVLLVTLQVNNEEIRIAIMVSLHGNSRTWVLLGRAPTCRIMVCKGCQWTTMLLMMMMMAGDKVELFGKPRYEQMP
ncbi:hypothetical protein KCU61_g441, partial [Aureobasidium melanogenum]